MLSKIFSQKIKELFIKKKYQEAIHQIEEFSSIKDRPTDLSNLVEVCKILKLDKTKNDIISALLDFEDSYNNSKENKLTWKP